MNQEEALRALHIPPEIQRAWGPKAKPEPQVWTALSSTAKGREAIAAIAEHAQLRSHEHGPAGPQDKLLNWESVTEFGSFKISIRCDYNHDSPPGPTRPGR